MRRLRYRRLLWNLAAGCSALVCAALLVLWVRSAFVSEVVRVRAGERQVTARWTHAGTPQGDVTFTMLPVWYVRSWGGNLYAGERHVEPHHWPSFVVAQERPDSWYYEREEVDAPAGWVPWRVGWSAHRGVPRDGDYYDVPWLRQAVVPHWMPALVAAALPALWLRAVRRRRRRIECRQCVDCGYDLRTRPDVCPECGAPNPGPHLPRLGPAALAAWEPPPSARARARAWWWRRRRPATRAGAVAAAALAAATLASTPWWPPVVPFSAGHVWASLDAEGKVELRWSKALGAESYQILRREGDGAFEPWFSFEGSTDETVDLSVVGGTAYAYRVIAINANGARDYAGEATVAAPRLPPRDVSADVDGPGVWLFWQNGTGHAHVLLSRSSDGGATFDWNVRLPADTSDYLDVTDGGQGAVYHYRVDALDDASRPVGPGATLAVTLATLSPPVGLTVTAVTADAVYFRWADLDDENGPQFDFDVDVVPADGGPAPAGGLDGAPAGFGGAAYRFDGLEASRSYALRVRDDVGRLVVAVHGPRPLPHATGGGGRTRRPAACDPITSRRPLSNRSRPLLATRAPNGVRSS